MPSGRNIEVKARLHEPARQCALAEEMAGPPRWERFQEDTFFPCTDGRLKLRLLADGTGELIHYRRLDGATARRSDYTIHRTSSGATLRDLLAQSLGIRGIVRKRRRLLLVGQTRIHLDDVEGLGHYLELEVVLRPGQSDGDGAAIARDLMAALEVRPADLEPRAYVDLLLVPG